MFPALLLLEFDSIAIGVLVGDAMAKRAPLNSLHAGTVQPGKYLILAGGEVANVDEARAAGLQAGRASLIDEIYLPEVHVAVVEALIGRSQVHSEDALGVVETRTVASTLAAADASVKGADVELQQIRLADGLGGKGYYVVGGSISDVEAAVEFGVLSLSSRQLLVERVVIPRMHEEMRANLQDDHRFAERLRTVQASSRK